MFSCQYNFYLNELNNSDDMIWTLFVRNIFLSESLDNYLCKHREMNETITYICFIMFSNNHYRVKEITVFIET